MITDGQIHLRDTLPANSPPGAELTTAEWFLPMMADFGIDRALIVPPGTDQALEEYALDVAARYPDRFAVMGWYRPDDPNAIDVLERWRSKPGFKAIRHGIRKPDPALFDDGADLDVFFRAAQRVGIPVSIFGWEGLSGLTGVFSRYPGLRVIVDHANLVMSQPSEIGTRIDDLVALAKYPNVAAKVSAMPAFSGEEFPYRDLHDPLRRIYQAFGPQRMIWGSDHTMVSGRGKATYRESLDFIRETGGAIMPAAELDWVLDRSIANWLNWPR